MTPYLFHVAKQSVSCDHIMKNGSRTSGSMQLGMIK